MIDGCLNKSKKTFVSRTYLFPWPTLSQFLSFEVRRTMFLNIVNTWPIDGFRASKFVKGLVGTYMRPSLWGVHPRKSVGRQRSRPKKKERKKHCRTRSLRAKHKKFKYIYFRIRLQERGVRKSWPIVFFAPNSLWTAKNWTVSQMISEVVMEKIKTFSLLNDVQSILVSQMLFLRKKCMTRP